MRYSIEAEGWLSAGNVVVKVVLGGVARNCFWETRIVQLEGAHQIEKGITDMCIQQYRLTQLN